VTSWPRVLVIVPARGGSKGVPRKSVRLLHGMPLIGHVLRTLSYSRFAPAVWVTTDDDEIADVAERYGASVVRRPPELAADDVTLDPVVSHAVTSIESSSGTAWDVVATVQPTSPLLSAERFDAAVAAVAEDGYDSAITVIRDAHLRWRGALDRPQPGFAVRLNRQQLPPEYRETGAVLASRREHVTPQGRFGSRVRLIELPADEAVDIDSNADWWLADNFLDRRRIAFRADGGAVIGLGHVHRALTLSSRLFNHDIRFFMDPALPDGIRLARLHGMHVTPTDNACFTEHLSGWRPDVVLLDVLDTERPFVEGIRRVCDVVATFEDLGSGADAADLVFNELYADSKADGIRRFCGPDVACLREEFYSVRPRATQDVVRNILVTFGGTDPNNLTAKALQALEQVDGDFHVSVVLGLGYSPVDSLEQQARASRHAVEVHQNVRNISTFMTQADLALTSAGRTVFELIACQTPVVALAQNARELLHTCTDERHGVQSLGLGADVSAAAVADAVRLLLPLNPRIETQRRMAALDLWNGPDRIISSILYLLRAKRLRDRSGHAH
jgi:spore coat polysaccharide biosynthesis predicted glycosyltransferase SpsG/CMP-N-acetylneuraminic acid synthetase